MPHYPRLEAPPLKGEGMGRGLRRQVRVTDATGLFRHPLQEFRDTLARPDTGRSPGQYRFQADLPNPGKWTFVFRATATGGVRVRRDFDVHVCDR